MKWRTFVLLTVAAFGCHGGAIAQKETVEGAQKFISLIAGGTGLTLVPCEDECGDFTDDNWERRKYRTKEYDPYDVDSGSRRAAMPERNITGMEAPQRCALKLIYSRWSESSDDEGYDDLRFRSSGALEVRRSWAEISGIDTEDAYINFETKALPDDGTGLARYRLRTMSPEYAARVAYAMEYLRLACDPSAATGF